MLVGLFALVALTFPSGPVAAEDSNSTPARRPAALELTVEEQRWLSPMSDQSKRCPQFEPLLRAHGLPVKIFSFIAWRESKCIIRAAGWNYHPDRDHSDCPSGVFTQHLRCEAVKSADLGLLQINSTWRTVTRDLCGQGVDRRIELLFDVHCNLKVARYLFANGGLHHWRPNAATGRATDGSTVDRTPAPPMVSDLPGGTGHAWKTPGVLHPRRPTSHNGVYR